MCSPTERPVWDFAFMLYRLLKQIQEVAFMDSLLLGNAPPADGSAFIRLIVEFAFVLLFVAFARLLVVSCCFFVC